MSHRAQTTFSDDQYELLRAEADLSGLPLAELVRRAVERIHGAPSQEEIIGALKSGFGSWGDRDDMDGAAHVERRRRGMARRLGGVE